VRLILHIFHKDAIRLWPQASIFAALLALNGWAARRYAPYDPPAPLSFLPLLLPVACSVLLIALVHEEGLVGDRKYWLSRPFPRRRLMAAKILFALVFINLPLFLYQGAIVIAAGLPLSQNWMNLVSLQLFFTAVDILPVAALAAVTRNMVRTILAALITVAAIIALSSLDWSHNVNVSRADGMSWIDATVGGAILVAMSLPVLFLQYSRRATMLARAILAGSLVLIVFFSSLPFGLKWAIQTRLSPGRVEPPAVRIIWNAAGGRVPLARDRTIIDDLVQIEIPIRIVDLPAGASVNVAAIQPIAEAASGAAWRPGWIQGSIHDLPDGGKFESISMDREFFQRVKDTPIRLYGVTDVTVLATVQTLPFPLPRRVDIPGIGTCASYPDLPGVSLRPEESFVSCNSMLPSARLVVLMDGRRVNNSTANFAPYPTSPGYSPLESAVSRFSYYGPRFELRERLPQIHLEIQKPVAYIQRPFDFEGIRLADYAMEPPPRH
jgi:hypothetical protein